LFLCGKTGEIFGLISTAFTGSKEICDRAARCRPAMSGVWPQFQDMILFRFMTFAGEVIGQALD
jgi:hypothetical protein